MVHEYMMEEEQLWWVRYVYKRDLAFFPELPPKQEQIFVYARDEAAARKYVTGWMHYIKRDGVVVQAIEQVPPGFHLQFIPGLLQELPEGAKICSLPPRDLLIQMREIDLAR